MSSHTPLPQIDPTVPMPLDELPAAPTTPRAGHSISRHQTYSVRLLPTSHAPSIATSAFRSRPSRGVTSSTKPVPGQ